jgi:hypothetical protein
VSLTPSEVNSTFGYLAGMVRQARLDLFASNQSVYGARQSKATCELNRKKPKFECFYEKVIKVKADVAALTALAFSIIIIFHHHLFVSGHRAFWICFEPSFPGNSG